MTLPHKVGTQRNFWTGLLLSIVTLGIYGLYWNWKVHNEIFEQFELKKEGRDEGMVFFIVGIFVNIVRWIFQYRSVEDLNYVRARSNMAPGVGAGEVLAWQLGSYALMLVLIVPVAIAAPF